MSNIKCYNNKNNQIGHLEYKDLETVDFTLQNTGNTAANVRLFASNLGLDSISDSGTTLMSVNSGPNFYANWNNYAGYNGEGYIINSNGLNLDIFDFNPFTGSPTTSNALTAPTSFVFQNIIFIPSQNEYWVFGRGAGGTNIDRFNLTTKALISNSFVVGMNNVTAYFTLLESNDRILFYSNTTAYEFQISTFTLLSSIPFAGVMDFVLGSYTFSTTPLRVLIFGNNGGDAYYQIINLTTTSSTNYTLIDTGELYIDSKYDSSNNRYVVTTTNKFFFVDNTLSLSVGPVHNIGLLASTTGRVNPYYESLILEGTKMIIGFGNNVYTFDLGGNLKSQQSVTASIIFAKYNDIDKVIAFGTDSNNFPTYNFITEQVTEFTGVAVANQTYRPQFDSSTGKTYYTSIGATGIAVELVFEPQIRVVSSSGAGDNLNGLLNIFLEKTHNPINIEYVRIDCFDNNEQPKNPLQYIYVTSRGIDYSKRIPLIWARTTMNRFPILILDKERLANEYVAVDGKRGFIYKIEANTTVFIQFGYKQDVRTDGENLDLSMAKDGIYHKVKGYLE